MSGRKIGDLDKLDRLLLKVLSKDPRAPYSDIAAEIEEEGYEMSDESPLSGLEAVRADVDFLPPRTERARSGNRPCRHLRLRRPGAKERALEEVGAMPFWLVCRGVGSYDIYAVGTATSNTEVDAPIREVEELDSVVEVGYSIETERMTNVDDYLSPEQLS